MNILVQFLLKKGLNNIPISVKKCSQVISEPLCSINITDNFI